MPGHPLADRTSRALHTEVARRLRDDPSLVARAAARVAVWDAHPHHTSAWRALLAGPIDALCDLLEADDDRATELRSASPFAGVLDAATRWRIWRAVRAS